MGSFSSWSLDSKRENAGGSSDFEGRHTAETWQTDSQGRRLNRCGFVIPHAGCGFTALLCSGVFQASEALPSVPRQIRQGAVC